MRNHLKISLALLLLVTAAPSFSIDAPEHDPLAHKRVGHPGFALDEDRVRGDALAANGLTGLAGDLRTLGAVPERASFDRRSGRWASLLMATPLVPGSGVGNELSWSSLGMTAPGDDHQYVAAVHDAMLSYLQRHQSALGIDINELEPHPAIVAHDKRRVVSFFADREYQGIPVRGSYLVAAINSGNLLGYRTKYWGDINVSTKPALSKAESDAVIQRHLGKAELRIAKRALELVPTAVKGEHALGAGYEFRLAWTTLLRVAGHTPSYLAMVDAHSGELLAFQNYDLHFTRRVMGGVYPVSNDQTPPDGIEYPNQPMPFLAVTSPTGGGTTSTGGIVDLDGVVATNLVGTYVQLVDNCGTFNEISGCPDLNFGATNEVTLGTDCDIPPVGQSAANTHSSRTGWYELNKLIESVRSRVCPGTDPICAVVNGPGTQANMNINNACNAFFTPVGGSINFYREGSTPSGLTHCRNTGEIAAVFDHEWGHFIDFADGNGLSQSSESYGDIVGTLRLADTCFGRGFFDDRVMIGVNCSGNGDPCLDCTGVRETNWKKRASGLPHDIDWILHQNAAIEAVLGNDTGCGANPTPPTNPAPPPPGLSAAPCDTKRSDGNDDVHCEGQVPSEAVTDLFTRDLRCHGFGWEDVPSVFGNDVSGGRCVGDIPPTLDQSTSLELATKMFYIAKSFIQDWFICDVNNGGCDIDNGFTAFAMADDDNGLLADGTPHGQALNDAFARHQIACPSAPLANGGCVLGEPARVQNLVATPTPLGVDLTWDAVPGAGVTYQVLRSEGPLGCSIGKTILTETALTSYSDGGVTGGLLDGYDYHYSVMPVLAGCYGQASVCTTAQPLPDPGATGPAMTVGRSSAPMVVSGGDSDKFLDNCEVATVEIQVANAGGVPLTGVQVIDVQFPSHPGTVLQTTLPIALPDLSDNCGSVTSIATEIIAMQLNGAAFDDALEVEVTVTANELGSPVTDTFFLDNLENDFVPQNVTFGFDTDLEGWELFSGTWTHTPAGGAPGGYAASSAGQNDACDKLRSPQLFLTPDSTLTLDNQFSTEPENPGSGGTVQYYDRANVGIIDNDGSRTLISPDGGRLYNADDAYTGCNSEDGWATGAAHPDADVAWGESTWSAAAMQSGSFTGRPVQIELTNGTDPLVSVRGLWVDNVTITNVLAEGPDAQSDVCTVGQCTFTNPLAAANFESNDFSEWDFVRNPQGDLSLGNLALEGAVGMEVAVDHSTSRKQLDHYVTKSHTDTPTYCWSFLFDPNSVSMPNGSFMRIWGARGDDNRRLLIMAIRNIGGTYHVALQVYKDGGAVEVVPFTPIPDGPVLLGGEWSNTANGGILRMFVDGALAGEVTGVTNVSRQLRTPGMGNLGQLRRGTLGSVYFDAFAAGNTP